MALPVPEGAAAGVEAAVAQIRHRYPGARWIPAPHLHLTVAFLGEITPTERQVVISTMRELCARHAPVGVELHGGSGRARRADAGIAWLMVAAGGEAIVRLAAGLHTGLDRIPSLRQRSRAVRAGRGLHVTVARRASSTLIDELARSRSLEGPIAWTATELVLFRSHLGAPGARYEAIARTPLAQGK